jgi:hypothetical protein
VWEPGGSPTYFEEEAVKPHPGGLPERELHCSPAAGPQQRSGRHEIQASPRVHGLRSMQHALLFLSFFSYFILCHLFLRYFFKHFPFVSECIWGFGEFSFDTGKGVSVVWDAPPKITWEAYEAEYKDNLIQLADCVASTKWQPSAKAPVLSEASKERYLEIAGTARKVGTRRVKTSPDVEGAGPSTRRSVPVEEGPDEDQLGSQGWTEWQEFDKAQAHLPDHSAAEPATQKATPRRSSKFRGVGARLGNPTHPLGHLQALPRHC